MADSTDSTCEFPQIFHTVIVKEDKDKTVLRASLKDENECKVWLADYSAKSNTNWIVYYELPDPQRVVLHKKWICHSSNKNKKSKEHRNTNCKCKIDVKIKKVNCGTKKNDSYLKAIVPLNAIITIEKKHNHNIKVADSLRFLRVTEETKKKYYEYFDSGMQPPEAMRQHANLLLVSTNGPELLANASINPNANAVYYLHRKWSATNFGSQNPLDKLKEKLDGYREQGAHVALRQDGDLWSVLVVTPLMQRLQKKKQAKEMVFIDSSSSCDISQTNITVVSIATNAGALPIAILLHVSQSQENYSQAFSLLKDECPNCFGGSEYPDMFMTDDSAAERAALREIWPQSKLLLCHFHVAQAEWRWLLSSGKKGNRVCLMRLFQKVMYADTEESFEAAVKSIESLKEKEPKFVTRFNKFLKRKDEWAMLYRINLITRNNNTNNYSEATIRIVKDIVLCRTKAFNVVALVEFCIFVWEPYNMNRLLNVAYNRCSKYRIFHSRLCQRLRDLDPTTVIEVEPNLYEIPSAENAQDKYVVNTEVGHCTCKSGRQGGFCKHQAWLHKHFSIPLPNAPPVTAAQRYELGRLALGEKCPKYEFFLGLREVEQELETHWEAPPVPSAAQMNTQEEDKMSVITSNSSSERESESEDMADVCLEDVELEFRRILSLHKTQDKSSKMIGKILHCLKTVKTPNQATIALIGIRSAINSSRRRGGRIHTQPTAAARRRHGLSRGSRPAPMGRPTKTEVAKRSIKKRGRNLGAAISQNVANAKTH